MFSGLRFLPLSLFRRVFFICRRLKILSRLKRNLPRQITIYLCSDTVRVSACLCCMNPHDPKRIVYPSARQYWRAFVYVMHLHENHCIKRAGVAGLRARAVWEQFYRSDMLKFCSNFEVGKTVQP